MVQATFSKKDALKFGWNTFHQNYSLLLGVFIVFALVNYLQEIIWEIADQFIIGTVLDIIFWVLSFLIGLGVINITLKLADNKPAGWGDLLNKSRLFWKYLWSTLLYIIIVLLGFIALILPGIYLSVKYFFYSYVIIDKESGPLEAMKKSGEITEGHKWNLLIFLIILAAINLAAVMPVLFIAEESPLWVHMLATAGLLITMPISYTSAAYVYRQLEKKARVGQD